LGHLYRREKQGLFYEPHKAWNIQSKAHKRQVLHDDSLQGALQGGGRMGEIDWAGLKVWLAQGLATLCEMAEDDSAIVEVAVMASNMLTERRGRQKDGN